MVKRNLPGGGMKRGVFEKCGDHEYPLLIGVTILEKALNEP